MLFDDGEELSRHLARLLRGVVDGGGDKTELERLREGAAEAATERWAENWERNALPLFREARAAEQVALFSPGASRDAAAPTKALTFTAWTRSLTKMRIHFT